MADQSFDSTPRHQTIAAVFLFARKVKVKLAFCSKSGALRQLCAIMASFLRGKQAGMQNDLSAGIPPQLFAPDEQLRYGINSQIR